MKRTAIVATFLATCLIAIPSFAQPAGAPGRAAGPAAMGQPVLGAGGQKAGARLARLGLDAATAQKVQQIHQKYQAERKPIRQQVRTHRQALAQLIRSDSNDQNAYRTAITGLQTARKQLEASKDREMAELQQILTPKQQAQLLAVMHRRANKGPGHGGQPPRAGRGQRGAQGPGAAAGPRRGR